MRKRILVELEHRADKEDARKFVTEQMKKRKIKGQILTIEKNNYMSFVSNTGHAFFDVVVTGV